MFSVAVLWAFSSVIIQTGAGKVISVLRGFPAPSI